MHDVNAKNKYDKTPLEEIPEEGALKLLLKAGAK